MSLYFVKNGNKLSDGSLVSDPRHVCRTWVVSIQKRQSELHERGKGAIGQEFVDNHSGPCNQNEILEVNTLDVNPRVKRSAGLDNVSTYLKLNCPEDSLIFSTLLRTN